MPKIQPILTYLPQMTKTTTRPDHPIIQPLKDGTARLLKEWRPTSGPPIRPLAVRYSMDDRGDAVIRNGALLGFDRIHPCVLLMIVRIGDLISLGEKPIGKATANWTHYKVGRGFRLLEIAIAGRGLTHAEIRSLVGPSALMEQPPGCDDSLRAFIADTNHPKWLIPIIKRQIQKWRVNRPSKFYHFVPSAVPEVEIPRVVKMAPDAALRFFLPKLTKLQIRSCVRRALPTAVIHAFSQIPPTQFKKALRDHPGLLLALQGKNLSQDQLLRCVGFEPFNAFVMRKHFPPALHAKILATTCGLPFQLFKSGNVSRLPAEIQTSFYRYPVQWLEVFDHDFSKLFRALVRHGKMKADQKLLQFLMTSLPPQHRSELYKFIAINL